MSNTRIKLPSIKELTKLPLLEQASNNNTSGVKLLTEPVPAPAAVGSASGAAAAAATPSLTTDGLPTPAPRLPLIRYHANYIHQAPQMAPAMSPETRAAPDLVAPLAAPPAPAAAAAPHAAAPLLAPISSSPLAFGGYMTAPVAAPTADGAAPYPPMYLAPIYYHPVYYHPGAQLAHQLPLPPALAAPGAVGAPGLGVAPPPQYAVPEVINRPTNKCHRCGTTETPEWRRGPNGVRTLCNACGLFHAKLVKRKGAALAAEEELNNKVTKGKNGRRISIKKHMLLELAAAAAAAGVHHHPMAPHMAPVPMGAPPVYSHQPPPGAPYYAAAPYPIPN